MVKLTDNKVALINLGTSIRALEDLDKLIEFYSVDKPGPAYVTFTYVDGPGEVKTQFNREIMLTALKSQRQTMVLYFATLGIEV